MPIGKKDLVIPVEKALSPEQLKRVKRVSVGLHLENVYNLDTPAETFNADGWYWLVWPQEVQALMDANAIKPDGLVEIVNNTLGFDLLLEPDLAEPEVRADGSRYQLFRFSGSFYSDGIDLRRYPFNLLAVPIKIEVKSPLLAVDGPNPVLLDLQNGADTIAGEFTDIAAFKSVGLTWDAKIHRYATDFGRKGASTYSQAELRLFYRTPFFSSFATWILPLLVLMATVFLAPSLEASLGDLRFAIPSAVLLTLVVMQQTYQAELKPLPYLTFLDRIYLSAYVVTIALFVLFVWGTNVMESAKHGGDEGRLALLSERVRMGDYLFQVFGIAFLFVAAVVAWVTI